MVTVIYSFKGQTVATIQERFSILSDVHHLGPNSQVIQDCDILEDDFNIAINKIITRPECNTKTYVQVGPLAGIYYRNQVGKAVENIKNPLERPDENSAVNRCLKTSVTVKVKTDERE